MTANRLSNDQYAAWGLIAPERRIPIPNGGPQDAASILDGPLARTPDAEALVGRHARYTYAQLETLINSASAALSALGVKPGDHVACSSTNHPDIVIALMATQRLGCVWIGIAPKLAAAEKAYMLQDSEAQVFISDAATLAAVDTERDLPLLEHRIVMEPGNPRCQWVEMLGRHMGAGRPGVQIDPWAPAAVAYTSGTTGFPKGVVHSQHNLITLGACRAQERPIELYRPGRIQGLVQPAALLNVFAVGVVNTWINSGKCICVDRQDAVGLAEWIAKEKIESASLAPATVFDLLTLPQIDPSSLASLRYIVLGGGPATQELRDLATARLGSPPLCSYGLTEAPGAVAILTAAEPCPSGASGYAQPHIRLAVLGANDEVLPPGTMGEICVGPCESGPWAGVYNLMLGYWRKPEATAKALRGGWLRTGDFGFLDENGYVTLTARMNDVILRGGANVYPAEIERVLAGLQEVRACAVLGRPDPRLGETIEAFVQLMPGVPPIEATRTALAAGCRAKLAKYKVPAHWTFVDEMPRNSMQKIVKSKLRELHPA